MELLSVVFVGAFPPVGSSVQGGNVTDCRILLASSFPRRLRLTLVDSTQRDVPPPPLYVRLGDALRRAGRILRLLGSKPDALLLFSSGGLSLAEKGMYAWYARLCGVPALLFIRTGNVMSQVQRSRVRRLIFHSLVGGVTRLLCQGPSWRSFFVNVCGYEASRCPIIPNWAADQAYLELGASRSYAVDGPIRLLFVGWLSEGKGIFELLEAVRRLTQDKGNMDLVLDVCGEGAASQETREFAARHQLPVRFHGWVTGEQKRSLFANATIFVLPSHAEGLPNAMVEAMAAGLPVVVTPVGCIADFVVDREHGRLVPPRDVAALASAISDLSVSEAERHRLGQAATDVAWREFRVEVAADRFVEVIRDVATPTRRE